MQASSTSISSNTWLSDGCALLDIGLGEGLQDDWHEQVGPYRLIEKLGEGGLGVVWRAEQTEPMRREVAVKLIKPGLHRSAEIITRFELERQALARMSHPNIAAILDAGTLSDERPWFVMELVPGEPLTTFCKSRQLSRAGRLHLMINICRAVHHAHQKGILHRDLKPSNILVHEQDGKAVPKIIDFGIAKALDGADAELSDPFFQTRLGDAPSATYPYMSPEQAIRGVQELDTRSDIYTLGVILYELLTGRLPMPDEVVRSGSYEKIADHVRTVDAVPPSNHEPALKGDLDWICLRALEKDPERRYESAAAFAEDMRRYLADEPVSAGPPSAVYRFGKWARRNRVAFITSSLVITSITVGLVSATLALVREREALQRESAARQQADANLNLALQREREATAAREAETKARLAAEEARKAAELARNAAIESRRTSDVARATAESLINDIVFDLRDQLEPIGRLSLLEPVSRSAEHYFNAVPAAADNDDQQRNRAVVLQSRGALLFATGDLDAARQKLEESLKLFRQRASEQPEVPRRQHDLALALERLGSLFEAQGKPAEASSLYEEMRSSMERAGTKLDSADASLPDERLGDLALRQGHPDEALLCFQRGISALEHLGKSDSTAQSRRAVLLEKVGAVHELQKDVPGARKLYLEALSLVEPQLHAKPDDANVLAAAAVLHGKLAAVSATPEEALGRAREQAAAFGKLVQRDPLRLSWQRQHATAQQQLGAALEATGDNAAAATAYRSALDTATALRSTHPGLHGLPREVAAFELRLAAVLLKMGSSAEAKAHAARALELLQSLEMTAELQQWQRTAEAIFKEQ